MCVLGRRLAAFGGVAALLAPARGPGDGAEPRPATSAEPLRVAGDRPRASRRRWPSTCHGPAALRPERGHLRSAGVEREARRLLHARSSSRARLPLPHRGARRRARQVGSVWHGSARARRATATRRSQTRGHPATRDRIYGARHPPRHGPRRRRRLLVRRPLDRYRLAAGVLRSPSRRRSPRSSSIVAWHKGSPVRDPAPRGRGDVRPSSARGDRCARRAAGGRRAPARSRLAAVHSGRLSRAAEGGRHRQRQLSPPSAC